MGSADREKFKLPKDLDDAKDLGRVLSNYKDDFYLEVIFGFIVTYVLYPSNKLHFLLKFFEAMKTLLETNEMYELID